MECGVDMRMPYNLSASMFEVGEKASHRQSVRLKGKSSVRCQVIGWIELRTDEADMRHHAG